MSFIFLCLCIERSGAYCFIFVRMSIHLSVCTKLTKLYFFPLVLNFISYKAHIWYEGTSHQYTPGSEVKVICKGQGQISGSCFSKDGCFRDISVSQIHLVFLAVNAFNLVLSNILSFGKELVSILVCTGYKVTNHFYYYR